MFHRVFTVRYITSKNCFCYLSERNSKYFDKGVTLKVSYGDNKVAYFSPQQLNNFNENEIGINHQQAQLLNLEESASVMVNICYDIPGIRRLTVSPVSMDDYEILDILQESVESTLLNQIRVVNRNQKFIIWMSNTLYVTVNVDAVDPVNPGRLDNLTELVIVQPQPRDLPKTDSTEINFSKWSIDNLLSNLRKTEEAPKNITRHLNSTSLLAFRLHPVKDLNGTIEIDEMRHFNVFVYHKHLPRNFNFSNDIFELKIIIPPLTEEDTMNIKPILVKLCTIKEVEAPRYPIPILFIHGCIFERFGIEIGSKAVLENCIKSHPHVNSIEICTTKAHRENSIGNFKSFLSLTSKESKQVLNAGFVINHSNFPFSLKFLPSNSSHCIIDSDFVRNCKYVVASSELIVENKSINKCVSMDFYDNFGNLKNIIEDATFLLKAIINSECFPVENVLIVGRPGTGKTILTKILTNALNSYPGYVHSEIICCKSIKGKSLESLHKIFSNKISNLVYFQPSILILDDFHVICEKVVEGDVPTPETLHFNRVSEMLASLLSANLKCNQIAILATSESVLKLNQHVFSSRGHHLFKNVFNIGELTKDDRASLLKYLFNKKLFQLENVIEEQLAQKTEGFVVQDLVDLVDKAIFESAKEGKSEVTKEHCEKALNNTTALSLKDVQLHYPGDKDFSDIGGLEDVKKVLIECMLWPVQYPNLFGNAPLRLQSGLLLYGPPGTGKTILAGAAAKHCGLRLISIKGPELLSKYIGASEQAVRNVFEKAQSAKPCILFFDEFDSLAPRRGHDSTGVTDRVVNQLLTQLDGIESLSGVCVLAATSRPDLLDPALLRPGRLDRQILCPLPNKEARSRILESLSKKMVFAEDVDLLKISEKTAGYSGADLQAILYTAQLSTIDHLMMESKVKSGDVMEVNQNHLEEALKQTRPSLTKEENLKYKRIYSKFQQGTVVDVKSGSQRATLA